MGYEIDLHDLGFERAEAVFTTMRFRFEVGFYFKEGHYPRLIEGCRAQGIDVELLPSFEEMRNKIANYVIGRLGFPKDSVVKLFATPGYSADGVVSNGPPKFFVTVRPFVPRALGPLRLETQNGHREFSEVKVVGQYAFARRRIADAKARGFDEFLYFTERDGITESPYRNIFFVRKAGRRLVTPVRCLHGVTRQIVLEHAKEWVDVKHIELAQTIFPNRLQNFDEAFLTSSISGIVPVSCVDAYKFQTGKEALVTGAIQRGYAEYLEKYFKDRGV